MNPPARKRFRAAPLDGLLPTFRARVETLLEQLRDAGHEPVVFETLRTPERAAMLAAKGRGIRDSMHLYGAACDVVCAVHGWDCAKHRCDFFERLGKLGEALGLVWGGRWRRVDKPHLQAVQVADQARFSRLEATAREAFIAARL